MQILRRRTLFAAGLAAAVTAIALAGPAQAGHRHGGHHGERIDAMFERFDSNEDGKISQQEIAARRKQLFERHDANNDGKLSLAEYEGVWLEVTRLRMVRMFQKFDRDGDAQLTDKEISRRLDAVMGWMDRNDDGEIAREELRARAHHGNRKQHRMRRHHGDHDHHRGPGGRMDGSRDMQDR